VVDHALRRMIALADPGVYPEPATLRGTAERMSFTTELPIYGGGPTQWADVALSAETGHLLLRWTPHRHVEPLGPKPQWQDVVVLEGVGVPVAAPRGQRVAGGVGRARAAADAGCRQRGDPLFHLLVRAGGGEHAAVVVGIGVYQR